MDEELVDAYEARMKWKLDHDSALDDAREEGIEKGIEKGRMELVQKMLSEGVDLALISRCTGMDEAELEKLANS